MTPPKPPALKLLDQSMPSDVAAQIFGPSNELEKRGLTLREAFRVSLRALIDERHLVRGEKRSVLRKQIASDRRGAASLNAEKLSRAMRLAARQVAWDLEPAAELMEPPAADRLRKALQAATYRASDEAAALERS